MIGMKPKQLETVLVKAPHRVETYTDSELREFAACADPVTGPLCFMDHYFQCLFQIQLF
jgi:hypothetical protein